MTDANKTIIALDVGDRRIGYALASLVAKLPQPGNAIEAGPEAIKRINELIRANNVVALVMGLPRNLDGEDTQQTRNVRLFAERLKSNMSVPFYWQDEALTSQKAEEELLGKGVSYNKGTVDTLAATYILADFLRDHPDFSDV